LPPKPACAAAQKVNLSQTAPTVAELRKTHEEYKRTVPNTYATTIQIVSGALNRRDIDALAIAVAAWLQDLKRQYYRFRPEEAGTLVQRLKPILREQLSTILEFRDRSIASLANSEKTALQATRPGAKDVFVSKLNATGTGLVYSTYLGGSGNDVGNAIVLDSSNRAYVTGFTGSSNFPFTANAFQKSLHGVTDAFVTTLNATGNGFAFYSTFLGGGVDPALNVYVAGHTNSNDFPATATAVQKTLQGNLSAFVAKIVIAADLSITDAASPSPVPHGTKLTYAIKVTNNGPDSPLNAKITDVIPVGTTFVSLSTTTTICSAPPVGSTGTVTCVRTAALPKGGVITVKLVVQVNAAAGNTITNTAKVSAPMQDLKPSNNVATVKTAVD
jgi:uncharacterized repeat protein (TIGR01451 family)